MNLLQKIGSKLALAGLAAVMLVATPRALPAQNSNATVAANLADAAVDSGQPTEFHIDVVNGRTSNPPPAPTVDGLTITYSGQRQSQQFQLGNGFQMQRTTTTTYTYSIETSRAGRFTIPGQQIEVDGTNVRTLPITLTVLDAGATGDAAATGQTLSAELIVPKKSAYVGESFAAEVRDYFGMAVHFNIDSDPLVNGEGFSAQKFTKPQRVDTEVVDGAQVHVITYKTAITGAKIGELTIGPVDLEPVVQMPRPRQQRRRNFNNPFDDPFFNSMPDAFNMAPAKKVRLRTGTATVEIKPLPPGKPADFSGGIGEFKLKGEADPRKAQAGDPVTVRLVLSGRGNFNRIAAPVLSDDQGLRTYPATSKFKADDEVNLSGVETFEQVVIPQGPRSSLPPYRFSYLDPATDKYVTIETPPIPVEIIGGPPPAPVLSASPPTMAAAATPQPTPPPKPAEDILYIRSDVGPARNADDFLPPYRRRAFWAAQGAVLAVLLALAALGGARARSRNEKARRLAEIQRRTAELQRALRQEDTGRGEFYLAATQLAQLKTAVMASRPASSLSAADICRANGLDAQAAGSMEQIFHRHDELAYSGGRAVQEPVLADERRGVLAALSTLDKSR